MRWAERRCSNLASQTSQRAAMKCGLQPGTPLPKQRSPALALVMLITRPLSSAVCSVGKLKQKPITGRAPSPPPPPCSRTTSAVHRATKRSSSPPSRSKCSSGTGHSLRGAGWGAGSARSVCGGSQVLRTVQGRQPQHLDGPISAMGPSFAHLMCVAATSPFPSPSTTCATCGQESGSPLNNTQVKACILPGMPATQKGTHTADD